MTPERVTASPQDDAPPLHPFPGTSLTHCTRGPLPAAPTPDPPPLERVSSSSAHGGPTGFWAWMQVSSLQRPFLLSPARGFQRVSSPEPPFLRWSQGARLEGAGSGARTLRPLSPLGTGPTCQEATAGPPSPHLPEVRLPLDVGLCHWAWCHLSQPSSGRQALLSGCVTWGWPEPRGSWRAGGVPGSHTEGAGGPTPRPALPWASGCRPRCPPRGMAPGAWLGTSVCLSPMQAVGAMPSVTGPSLPLGLVTPWAPVTSSARGADGCVLEALRVPATQRTPVSGGRWLEAGPVVDDPEQLRSHRPGRRGAGPPGRHREAQSGCPHALGRAQPIHKAGHCRGVGAGKERGGPA